MSPLLRHGLLLLHLLGAVVWLGGMFFAYFCLRPAAAVGLQPPQRLPLWVGTFERFLRYAAVAVGLILVTGFGLFSAVGFRSAPLGWHVMLALGLVMSVGFGVVWLRLFPRLRTQSLASAWPEAARTLNAIRRLVAVNLALGLCVLVAAIFAR